MSLSSFPVDEKDVKLYRPEWAKPWLYLICENCGAERVVNLDIFFTKHQFVIIQDCGDEKVCWWECSDKAGCDGRKELIIAMDSMIGKSCLYLFLSDPNQINRRRENEFSTM